MTKPKMTRTQEAFVKVLVEQHLISALEQDGFDASTLVTPDLIDYVFKECGHIWFEHISFPALKRVDAFLQGEDFIAFDTAAGHFLEAMGKALLADRAPEVVSAIFVELLNPMDNPELYKALVDAQEGKEIAEFVTESTENELAMAMARAKQLAFTGEPEAGEVEATPRDPHFKGLLEHLQDPAGRAKKDLEALFSKLTQTK